MKIEIGNFIKATLENDYIQSQPLELFSIEDFNILAEKAKENNLLLTLKAEYSNLYQGTLVCLIRKDIINSTFLEYI